MILLFIIMYQGSLFYITVSYTIMLICFVTVMFSALCRLDIFVLTIANYVPCELDNLEVFI